MAATYTDYLVISHVEALPCESIWPSPPRNENDQDWRILSGSLGNSPGLDMNWTGFTVSSVALAPVRHGTIWETGKNFDK